MGQGRVGQGGMRKGMTGITHPIHPHSHKYSTCISHFSRELTLNNHHVGVLLNLPFILMITVGI